MVWESSQIHLIWIIAVHTVLFSYSKITFLAKPKSDVKNYENANFYDYGNESNYNTPQVPWKWHALTKDFQKYFKSIKNRHRIILSKNKWNKWYYRQLQSQKVKFYFDFLRSWRAIEVQALELKIVRIWFLTPRKTKKKTFIASKFPFC